MSYADRAKKMAGTTFLDIGEREKSEKRPKPAPQHTDDECEKREICEKRSRPLSWYVVDSFGGIGFTYAHPLHPGYFGETFDHHEATKINGMVDELINFAPAEFLDYWNDLDRDNRSDHDTMRERRALTFAQEILAARNALRVEAA